MLKTRTLFATFVLLGTAGVAIHLTGCSKAQASIASNVDRSLELTVYKADVAEVRDSRRVELTDGTTHIELQGVSKTLDPKSVIFEWPGQSGPEITANTYDLGVGSSNGLLKRFVGREVELVLRSTTGSEGQKLKGTLEMAENGIVLKVGDHYYVNPDGTIIAPSDGNLVTSPTLSADVHSNSTGEAKLQTTYMTSGMSWSADYVAKLTPNGQTMDLECWATITNRSGVDYPNSKITLVAGQPNIVINPASTGLDFAKYDPSVNSFVTRRPRVRIYAPEALGELYSYPIANSATIGQDQMNRVKMMSASAVPIVRDYSIEVAPGSGTPTRQDAQMAISFKNLASSGLGQPLPEGSIRAYESSGDRQTYIGGSSIQDIPKNDKVELTLSNAFDIYSRSVVVSTKRIGKRVYVRSYHADLFNEKKRPISLRVVYDTQEGAQLISQSAPSVRKDSSTLEWKLSLPAGGKMGLDFAIQTRS